MLPPLADLFGKIDPQVIFIIVVLVIGAVQSVIEKLRKNRAERELDEDLSRRAEERSESLEPIDDEPILDEVYEEYRREILERQRRLPEELDDFGEPEPSPPPLSGTTATPSAPVPPPLPAEIPTAPLSPPAWAQTPKPAASKTILTPEERAALASLQAREQSGKKRRRARRSGLPARRLLASPSDLRTAIVLKEILGPPKSLAD